MGSPGRTASRKATVPRIGTSLHEILAIGLAAGLPDAGSDARVFSDQDVGLSDFESTATERVLVSGGRALKFIGDEVMFRCEDPVAACRIAVGIFEACRRHREPSS